MRPQMRAVIAKILHALRVSACRRFRNRLHEARCHSRTRAAPQPHFVFRKIAPRVATFRVHAHSLPAQVKRLFQILLGGDVRLVQKHVVSLFRHAVGLMRQLRPLRCRLRALRFLACLPFVVKLPMQLTRVGVHVARVKFHDTPVTHRVARLLRFRRVLKHDAFLNQRAARRSALDLRKLAERLV